jgi:hypothetical protein
VIATPPVEPRLERAAPKINGAIGAVALGGVLAPFVGPAATAASIKVGTAATGTVVAATAFMQRFSGGCATAAGPELGSKLNYFFGQATGTAHNIARSIQMRYELARIGFFDSPASRQYVAEHLVRVFGDPSSIVRVQDNGRILRKSLLMGPQGAVKFETVWEGAIGDRIATVLDGHPSSFVHG